jgi:hypothetical protein
MLGSLACEPMAHVSATGSTSSEPRPSEMTRQQTTTAVNYKKVFIGQIIQHCYIYVYYSQCYTMAKITEQQAVKI